MSSLLEEKAFCLRKAGGGALRGYLRDPGSARLGIFIHGFRSDCHGTKAMALARHAARRDYAWLRFDLSGHGESDGDFGDFRLSLMLADLEAVLERFAEREVILIGSSMGAWLSVLAAQRRPAQLAGLLLLAPGFNFIQSYFGGLPPEVLHAWRETGWRDFPSRYGDTPFPLHFDTLADAAPFDVLSSPQHLACPVCIIHGEQDEVVPVAVSQAFMRQLHAPHQELRLVADGNHRLAGATPLICETLDRLWST